MTDYFTGKYKAFAFGALILIVAFIAAQVLLPFLPAILWAIVLTVLMYPIHKGITKKCSPNFGAAITTIASLLIIFIPLMLTLTVMAIQVSGFVREASANSPQGKNTFTAKHIIESIDVAAKPVLENLGAKDISLQKLLDENNDKIQESAGPMAIKAASAIGYTAFTLVVAFLTMFFMLRDAHKLLDPALELIPLPRDKSLEILKRMESTIHAVFVGVVLVALVQGTLAGIAYYYCGVPSALMWGVFTIILCTIPLLGAPVIYIPMSLLLMAQGKVVEGVVLLAVGFLVVSQIDNLLKPWIIGARVDLHPMAVFFSLLGGIFLFGPVGLMAGPVLLSLALALLDIIRDRLRMGRGEDLVLANE